VQTSSFSVWAGMVSGSLGRYACISPSPSLPRALDDRPFFGTRSEEDGPSGIAEIGKG